MSSEKKKGKKTISAARKKFCDSMRDETQRRSQTVKVLPKGVLPLVTSHLPQVSAVPQKGLVSAKPPITIPRYWGIPPSRKWGETKMPITRRIRALRPTEVGFFATLINIVGAPVSVPAHIVGGMINLADRFRGQAEEERLKSPEDKIKDELLELKMRYELDEVTEDEYKKEESKLDRRLKDIQQGRKKKATEANPAKSRAKRGERGRAVTGEKPKKKKPKKKGKKKPKKGKKKT